MKFKKKSDAPLKKMARHGMRGYPAATVAYYGPDDTRATKVAVGIVPAEGAEVTTLERWFSLTGDVRTDPGIEADILRFVREHGVKSIAMMDRIIGCPHEEGKDYPDGEVCPECPFWANRDRWTGEVVDEYSKAKALADWAIRNIGDKDS